MVHIIIEQTSDNSCSPLDHKNCETFLEKCQFFKYRFTTSCKFTNNIFTNTLCRYGKTVVRNVTRLGCPPNTIPTNPIALNYTFVPSRLKYKFTSVQLIRTSSASLSTLAHQSVSHSLGQQLFSRQLADTFHYLINVHLSSLEMQTPQTLSKTLE